MAIMAHLVQELPKIAETKMQMFRTMQAMYVLGVFCENALFMTFLYHVQPTEILTWLEAQFIKSTKAAHLRSPNTTITSKLSTIAPTTGPLVDAEVKNSSTSTSRGLIEELLGKACIRGSTRGISSSISVKNRDGYTTLKTVERSGSHIVKLETYIQHIYKDAPMKISINFRRYSTMYTN